jgi:hypothetical protein
MISRIASAGSRALASPIRSALASTADCWFCAVWFWTASSQEPTMSAATETATPVTSSGGLGVVACKASGQARSFRAAPTQQQRAAYRRLALAVLGLDVATLTSALDASPAWR